MPFHLTNTAKTAFGMVGEMRFHLTNTAKLGAIAMSILRSVVRSNDVKVGIRAVIVAQEKMGKTTFLASAPKPLLVPMEEGYAGVNVPCTPKLTKYQEVNALLDEVISARGAGYQSICFDSATALERLIHAHTIELDAASKKGKDVTMESAHGGYGKAYGVALNIFEEFLHKCDTLARNGINVVFAAHAFANEVIDPTVGKYESWDILLHSPKNNKTYGKREFITQWADVVGFLYEPKLITKVDDMNMGISKNQGHVMGLSRTPQYVAGNRFGVTGEIQVPKHCPWNALAFAIGNQTNGRIDVRNMEYL